MVPAILREYLARSSFHGLHYLVDKGLHWTEKLFWFICVLGSWSGSVYLMMSTLQSAYDNPINLSIDTDYLHWRTPFPAVIVCETNSLRVRKHYSNTKDADTFQQMVFFEYYLTYDTIHEFINDTNYYKNFRTPCLELFNYCEYNKEEFNCCKNFLPVETPFGTCFALNSLLTNRTAFHLKLHMHKQSATLILEFENPAVRVFAVSNEAMITEKHKPLVLQKDIYSYTEYKILISVHQIMSEPDVQDIEISRRKCRFADENNLDVATKYSIEACNLQCQKEAHLLLYNCTHHYMPNTEKKHICGEKDLIKLTRNLDQWNEVAEKICNCELGCDISDIYFLGRIVSIGEKTVSLNNENTKTYVSITFNRLSNKVIRKRARNMLDNIVSLGGTAGLFVGASILSVLELIYYLTIRAISSSLIKEKTKKLSPKINVFPFVK